MWWLLMFVENLTYAIHGRKIYSRVRGERLFFLENNYSELGVVNFSCLRFLWARFASILFLLFDGGGILVFIKFPRVFVFL